MAKVTTYLNFNRETEAAFNFYKSIFGGEFSGSGITRFSDYENQEGFPDISEADKKLVMHVELPILGCHHLMGTDAPETMGFKLIDGNNIHINIVPDNRNDTKRLFLALAEGGIVTMDLHDTFWGAYYGSCTDKFGIHWMFNCTSKE